MICERDLVSSVEYLPCRQKAIARRRWPSDAGSCPTLGALLGGISEFHRLHSPARSQQPPFSSLVPISGHVLRHFYHFRGYRQAQVTTRLLFTRTVCGGGLGACCRSSSSCHSIGGRDLHRTTAAHGRACRPKGRWGPGWAAMSWRAGAPSRRESCGPSSRAKSRLRCISARLTRPWIGWKGETDCEPARALDAGPPPVWMVRSIHLQEPSPVRGVPLS